ncbi:MAG: C4-type zinc ribbon domain-containing protein [Deltaproteobacteria bacterium]|nr:C4-type zinc ribbon domain-containing protein [Deltaproteobacteria bacterium]
MKEIMLVLIELQKMDNQLAKWHGLIAGGPARLTEARLKLSELESELAELKASLAENGRRRRELEAESADLVIRKSTNQSRQLKAKNNEEYRAVLKEAETITAQIAKGDEEQLALMAEAESQEEKQAELEKTCQAEKEIYQAQSEEIEKTLAESRKLEQEAQITRTRLTEALPKEVLGRYLTVAKNRGQALAGVSGGLCQGCRLSVPPQLFNELQRNDKLLACPNCARIIYWPDHPDLQPEPENAPEVSLEAHG